MEVLEGVAKRGHPGTGRNIYMATTRNDSLHVVYLLRLAATLLGWKPINPRRDGLTLARQIDALHDLTSRHEDDPTAYRAITANAAVALAYMGRHLAVCNDFGHVRADFITVRDMANAYLRSLTPDQRRMLAAFEGFKHAHLVEENTRPGGDGALVMWLNPVYDSQTNPDLLKVQHKALNRYAERYPDLETADQELGLIVGDAPANVTVLTFV
ncbi:hypothetical protein [Streptosporangium sp. NPDC051022]|uniref:hypothetical protein n=1 Tax=Streptosporangium sp. NPDC051022 TaxID=3155752 RepID=UPI0034231B96